MTDDTGDLLSRQVLHVQAYWRRTLGRGPDPEELMSIVLTLAALEEAP